MPQPQRSGLFGKRDFLFLGLLTATGLILGLRAIVHYGYMGQDFPIHQGIILSYPAGYTYALTNPPGLYWLASFILHHISATYYLELTALLFLGLNTTGLCLFFRFIWQGIATWQLRYAAAAFITFVPLRVIHSIVIAADAFTIPAFALAALLTLRLLDDPRRVFSWIGLSLCLCVALVCKYTFVGLFPPLGLILAVAIARRLPKEGRLRWAVIGLAALLVPAGVFYREMRESEKVNGATTYGHWKVKGTPSVMRWQDILTVKTSDMAIFSAPEYIKGELYEFRKYSYPALVHVSALTDCLNFFQKLPPEVSTEWGRRTQHDFVRIRTARSQAFQTWSVRLGLPYSMLALVATLFCGALALQSLFSRKPLLPNATVVITALAAGYYGVILFNLPRVGDPYTAGYWLPRLVLPALVIFYALGFVLLDFVWQRLRRPGPIARGLLLAFTVLTAVVCAVFTGFLI